MFSDHVSATTTYELGCSERPRLSKTACSADALVRRARRFSAPRCRSESHNFKINAYPDDINPWARLGVRRCEKLELYLVEVS